MYGARIIAKLQQKKYRQEFGCFVVEGKKGVLDALEAGANVLQLVVTDEFAVEEESFCHQPVVWEFFTQHQVLIVKESDFRHLVESVTPQGIAAVVRIPATSLTEVFPQPVIALLEDIRDPGNLGTMIRTADWFGVGGLLLVGGADPYQPKVVRSSMGSLFHVPIVVSQDLTSEIRQLKEKGFRVVVTRPELSSEITEPISSDEKMCVVFGNEAFGTSETLDRLADRSLSIPKFGAAESLNVAVSFGIVMHEIRR